MNGVVRRVADRGTLILGTTVSRPDVVLLALLVAWIILCLIVLGRRRPRSLRCDPPDDCWLSADHGSPDDGPRRDARTSGGWQSVRRLPLQVITPDTLPTWATSDCVTVAADVLEDIAGPLLDAGHRRYIRSWSGVLLHGAAPRETAEMARALAGEHDVPLAVVRARDIGPLGERGIIRAILERAASLAPCVLLIEGVDEVAGEGRLVVSGHVSGHARRLEHELATALRSLPRGLRVAVICSAFSIDGVANTLLEDGCLDRRVAVGAPNATQRAGLLRRELLFHSATFDGQFGELVGLCEGLSESRLIELVGQACQAATQRQPTGGGPTSVSIIDVRAALHVQSGARISSLAVERGLEERLHALRQMLCDEHASLGVALVGAAGNGKTTIARWLVERIGRHVVWLPGDDIAILPIDDIEATVAGACTQTPVVVVLDGLDPVLSGTTSHGRGIRKPLLTAIEHLARMPGAAVVVTLRDPALIDAAMVDDGTVELCWIPFPGFHSRVELIEHQLRHVRLADTTFEEIAARVHGRTCAQVADVCRAAIHSATLRHCRGRDPFDGALLLWADDITGMSGSWDTI